MKAACQSGIVPKKIEVDEMLAIKDEERGQAQEVDTNLAGPAFETLRIRPAVVIAHGFFDPGDEESCTGNPCGSSIRRPQEPTQANSHFASLAWRPAAPGAPPDQ